MTSPEPAHSLLHCHFESALRALAVARPTELEHLRPAFESPAYARATPAGRLSVLNAQVTQLTQGQDIFTRKVFAEVVRRLGEEMTSSGIGHVDLRVGVLMRRWPWITSLADAIGAFRAALPGPDTLTVSFLGAVNLSQPHDVLDAVFAWVLEDALAAGLLVGLDINMRPEDLATLDRYLARCATSSVAACASTSTSASCSAPGSPAGYCPAWSPAGSGTASCCWTTRKRSSFSGRTAPAWTCAR